MDENIMDWDDEVSDDGQEFIMLKEGDYDFEVTNFERGRFPGSAKIPPCNKAMLTLQVKTKDGVATIFTDIILYRKLEWKISEFFRCVGLKKKGEKVSVDWNKVVGLRGRARFNTRHYTDKNGNDREINNLVKFLEGGEKEPALDDEWMEVPEDSENLPFMDGGDGKW